MCFLFSSLVSLHVLTSYPLPLPILASAGFWLAPAKQPAVAGHAAFEQPAGKNLLALSLKREPIRHAHFRAVHCWDQSTTKQSDASYWHQFDMGLGMDRLLSLQLACPCAQRPTDFGGFAGRDQSASLPAGLSNGGAGPGLVGATGVGGRCQSFVFTSDCLAPSLVGTCSKQRLLHYLFAKHLATGRVMHRISCDATTLCVRTAVTQH